MSHATEQEAYELLKRLGISSQGVDHPTITSVRSVPFSLPSPQVKSLLLKSRKGEQIHLVTLPDEKRADLEQLAEQLKEKRLSFVSEEQLPGLLGAPTGTVTPLALVHDKEKKIQVVIDTTIDRQNTIGFHPNINTTTSIMDFSGFKKMLVYLEHLPVHENL